MRNIIAIRRWEFFTTKVNRHTKSEESKEEGKNLADVISQINNLDNMQKQNEVLKSDYINASKESAHVAEEYQSALKAFLDAQAGLLAKDLNKGVPCPVCGSTNHPKPAQLSQNAPDQNTIEKLKKQSQKLEDIAKEKSTLAGNMDGQVKSKIEQINTTLNELNIKGDIQKAVTELENKRDELRKDYKQKDEQLKILVSNQNEKTELQEKIEKNQAKLNDNTNACHQAETEIAALKSSVNENEKSIKELENTLPYSDKKSAQNAAKEIQDKINGIKTAQENARTEFDACREEISRLKGIIIQQEKNIAELNEKLGKEETDIAQQENELDNLLETQEKMQDELDEIKIRLAQNKATSEKLNLLQAKLKKVQETYQWMNDLDNVAGGKMSDNGKIDLETYVQVSIFDRILFYANQRLKDIAGNQYRLVRRQKSDDNRSGFALDLDIQDNFSDKVRPVQGLSGGETFEASLALALGLSDEIQANAGGIELDCMFIDEGFGSLSEEPLEKAVNCLYSLAQGKKLVGIISHVERLDSRIDDKITVTKDPVYGSSAKVVTSKL